MSSKYQIFVSSTYNDLKEPRDFVIKAILEMGHIPVGMEMFSAADEEQWSIIQRQIDQSDYYVLIMANRYGSVTEESISYTEKEYDYARSQSIPCLGFILESSASWPSNFTDTDPVQVEALSVFREKVKLRPVSFWKNTDDLYGKCSIALMKAFTAYPREGWVRASQYTDGKSTAELIRLSAENAMLRDQLEKSRSANEDKKSKAERDYLAVMRANQRPMWVWKKGAEDWEEIKYVPLLLLFQVLAPEMMVELTLTEMGETVAILICGIQLNELRRPHPMPTNFVKEWVADFSALGLVVPSKRKKPVADKDEYWTLSEKGIECLTLIRRYSLNAALKSRPVDPTAVEPSNGNTESQQ
ncbi:protein of unknown function [Pseudomonas syringae]|nr:protein of unknown function [Pseudomonas syringae]